MNLRRFEGTQAAKALFLAAAVFALVMALLPHPPRVPGNPSDKLQHAAAFATLALLGRFAFPRLSTLRLFLGLSIFGALIELMQAIPLLHRDCDPLDWLADTIACAVVLLLIGWLLSRKR